MFDLIREINQTLRSNRLRTVLTGLSVSWGVFMLVILLGASRGVSDNFNSRWNSRGSNKIQLWGGRTSRPWQGYRDGRNITLSTDDAPVITAETGAVAEVVPFAQATATVSAGGESYSEGLRGVFPRAIAEQDDNLTVGRLLNGYDIVHRRRSLVIPSRYAVALFGTDSAALGQSVEALSLAWTVVGVYNHPWNTETYVPYTTLQAITGGSGDADQLTAYLDGIDTEAQGLEAEEEIRTVLAGRHSFDPADRSAVWVWNNFAEHLSGMATMGYLNLGVWVLGLLTLLTGMVGVSNIMFVSVRERTHEIGIRRAIGARPRAILGQILAESVAVTAIFGYIGVVAGVFLLQVLASNIEEIASATVDISIALEVTAALVAAGALAGLFPALKALKVKPVEALRDE